MMNGLGVIVAVTAFGTSGVMLSVSNLLQWVTNYEGACKV